MGTSVTLNGTSYTIPAVGESNWGLAVTNYLVALSTGVLQKAGGSFTLTAEVDFGATYGLKSTYYKSRGTVAAGGVVRLGNAELISWRNAAGNGDLSVKVSAADWLQFNGVNLADISTAQTLINKTIVAANNTVTTAATGNLAATELNAALAELQGDIDTRATAAAQSSTASSLSSHTSATAAHGVAGNIVGTSDAQALTNKTIDGATNTLTVRLGNDVSGTLPIANGGTGQTSANDALNALLPTQTSNAGKVLATDGTNTAWASAASSTLTQYYVDIGHSDNTRTAVNTNSVGDVLADTTNGLTLKYAEPRNIIINGNFDFWQRGNAATAFTTAAYLADRWLVSHSTDGTATAERSTDVPSSSDTKFPATYSLLITVTSADTAISSGQTSVIKQRIEGANWAPFQGGQNLVLSFWVKSSLTGTFCASIRNSGTTRSLVKEYTISSANTWERKTLTFTSDSAGTWLADTGIGAELTFSLTSGSTYQTTAGTWQAGNYLATSNQANLFASTHTFRIAQVMLHRGTSAATFCRAAPTIQGELAACQRYYEKSYDVDVVPATNTSVGASWLTAQALSANTTLAVSTSFRVTKRATPNITLYPTGGSPSGSWAYGASAEAVATVYNAGVNQFGVFFNATAAGLTANNAVRVAGHWVADIEL